MRRLYGNPHPDYRRMLFAAALTAAVVHAVIIFAFVMPDTSRAFAGSADELEAIEIPPEIKIPPPPEEIARPATPVIAEEPEEVDEEITMAETEITEEYEPPPAQPPPEPEPPPAEEQTPKYSWTPYTVAPKCQNCDPDDIVRHIPPILKKSGFTCRMTVGIRIDTGGRVTATDVLQSSGNPTCDAAVQKWATGTRWSTAYNRDTPVVVWIAQPVRVELD
ncbi:MAG: energy transducer TonB [Gemmatimonadota bacterium]|nr:energy transducer TonB [Gemmatimonadota bacterium]